MRLNQGTDYGDYAGIDYGRGMTNKHPETGIRYGIIHQHHILEAWAHESEPVYPDVACVECGEKIEVECPEHGCTAEEFWELVEPDAFAILTDELSANSDHQGDVWVFESKYFTYAMFCSPCAPGACSLSSPIGPEHNIDNKCYCLSHDWFDEGKAPYRIWSIETGEEILLCQPTTPQTT